MSLLTTVQSFCSRTGLPVPVAVVGTQDRLVTQLLGLAQEVLEDLREKDLQALVREATFTTTAGEDQGSLNTLAPEGLLRIRAGTFFNRSLRLPVFGPVNDQEWQRLHSLPNTGPFYKYRIRGNQMLFHPAAVTGHTCAFEYVCDQLVLHADSSYGPTFTADTDTIVLQNGDTLLLAGLRWKWRSEKGLDYTEELRRYEELVAGFLGSDGTHERVNLADSSSTLHPGIWVPHGNWNIP